MNFNPTPDQAQIRDAVEKVCAPCSVETSAGSETQWPKADSSLAVWSQAAALRAEM